MVIVNNGTLYDRLVLCLVTLFNVIMVWLSLGTGLDFGGAFWLFGLVRVGLFIVFGLHCSWLLCRCAYWFVFLCCFA